MINFYPLLTQELSIYAYNEIKEIIDIDTYTDDVEMSIGKRDDKNVNSCIFYVTSD